jgi:tRNA (cytidine32/uridine32-2'-O)-methyltransferase
MPDALLPRIRIVLVNTTHAGNIGGAARAMKNMGLTQLYLVAPREFPSEEAISRAAGAADVLESAAVVATLEEAVADCALVVGTSARERTIPWPLMTPRECGDRVVTEAQQGDVAIVFGRESRGLTNDELHKCNYHVHIPSNPDYSSLNVGAAVQVLAYEVRMSWYALKEGKALSFDDWDQPTVKHQELERYYQHLQETLERLDFLQPNNPRQTMTRLRRLYGRVRLDKMELSILRGVLTAVQNYVFYAEKKIKDLSKAENREK